ncbi:MAG TPA: GNAT family N-acetyltransferase [Myxococcota bacterium]|nr:GNAT family N-acetyltransferase [Myxococcota bacterium]
MQRRIGAQAGAILETTRLMLRPFVLQDLDALHAFFIHPEVRRFLWDDRVVSRDTVQALIAASFASFSVQGLGLWVAEDRASRAFVGFCGLRPIDETAEIELLYGLVRERWGEGLATEAGNAVLAHAFLRVGLPRVVGRTDSPNLASVRVLERLGMQFEGERVVHGLPTLHYAISDAAFRSRSEVRPRF